MLRDDVAHAAPQEGVCLIPLSPSLPPVATGNIVTKAPTEWDNAAHMFREMCLDHNVVMALEIMAGDDVMKIQEIIKPYMADWPVKGRGKKRGSGNAD